MALILIALGIMTLLAISAFFAGKKSAKFIVKQSKQVEKNRIHTRENERQLREELLTLQNKLIPINEDPVTHLLGWKMFEDRLNQTVVESERSRFTFGLMYVDIKEFRLINNTLGTEIGNELLREVAERLQSCVRKVDSVSRVAKDSFVILLYQLAKPDGRDSCRAYSLGI